jgi:hypothetical protein
MGTAVRAATLHLRGELCAEGVNALQRWEWRVFARGVLPLRHEDLPALAAPEEPRQEVHLVSARSDAIVTVRGRHLLLARLERTAPGGLELWTPELSTEFPLAPRALQNVCEALGLNAPVPLRLKYTIVDFERDIVVTERALYPVAVTKRRTRLELMRCQGERVEFVVGGERWETIAFHDPDPVRVRAVVGHLGLGHFANVNFSAALRRIVGFAPDRSRRA